MKPKIALLHSETRDYRVPIFDRLNKKYDITFYFMYGAGWSRQYPESRKWKYKDLKRIPMIGYTSDFSPGIIPKLFKDYDIIITSGLSSFATHTAYLAAKLTGKKLILWDELWEWPSTLAAKLAKPYAKHIVKKADACIAAGTKAKEFYQSFGANPKKVFIANNCAVDMKGKENMKRVAQLRKQLKLEGKEVILYLGRIIKYKGLDYLIRAFKQIKNKNAFLLIAGPDHGWENECKKLAKQLKIQNIAFIGPVPHKDVANYYKLSEVFVLPARFLYEDNVTNEAWGLAVNEALSLSTPVVTTTAVAAGYDMIQNGKSGYLVKERDINELQQAIEKTLKNKKMKAEARKAFEQWNDYNKMLAGFKKAIEYVK